MKIKHICLILLLLSLVTSYLIIHNLLLQTQVVRKEMFRRKVHLKQLNTRLPNDIKRCGVGYFYSQIYHSCQPCQNGRFSFYGWIGCQPVLGCDDIAHDVRTSHLLSKLSTNNFVKIISLAYWYGYKVVHVKCRQPMFQDDCLHDIKMLQAFQGSPLVVQMVGVCLEKYEFVTTYYQHGSAEKLDSILPSINNITPERELLIRLQLSEDYLKILSYLHNSPAGIRVMCDAGDLEKTLSQYLITDDFHLVVNDLDALPVVDHETGTLIKCGHRELAGYFVAPEQLWPYPDEPFDDTRMPAYDEKIDIWKIPDVISWFLGNSPQSLQIKTKLKHIFSLCKSYRPVNRPTASHILKTFQMIVNTIEI